MRRSIRQQQEGERGSRRRKARKKRKERERRKSNRVLRHLFLPSSVKASSERRAFKANSFSYFEAAASHGHSNVIRWLREKGAEWDESALVAAAHNGHFELVKEM
jgi:hypothetical protein